MKKEKQTVEKTLEVINYVLTQVNRDLSYAEDIDLYSDGGNIVVSLTREQKLLLDNYLKLFVTL
jgi:hypothetical protein